MSDTEFKAAPLTYRLLRGLFKLAVHSFYHTVHVHQPEVFPLDGVPTILCPNHSNSLTDALLLMTQVPEKRTQGIRFTVKDTLLQHPIFGWFIRGAQAVPLMRKKDHAPGTTINNQPSLQRLKEVLKEGNCICIFPEGISRYHPSLATLQSGIAHLSFEVASTSNCEVYLQPCGLTYLHRSKFRSSVLVEFAPPVKVTPEMTEKTEILSLMEIALRRVTLNAPDWETIKAGKVAMRIYAPWGTLLDLVTHVKLQRTWSLLFSSLQPDYFILKNGEKFPDAVDLTEEQLGRVGQIKQRLLDYQAELGRIGGLKDYRLRFSYTRTELVWRLFIRFLLWSWLSLILLPGLLIFSPVFLLVKWKEARVLSRPGRVQENLDEVAQYKMLLSFFTLLTQWGFAIWWWWKSFTVIFGFPIWAWFTVRWLEDWMACVRSIKSLFLLWKLSGTGLLRGLQKERADLGEELKLMAEWIGLPKDSSSLIKDEEDQSGWLSFILGAERWRLWRGYFGIRRRRLKDWEEVLRWQDSWQD